MVVSTLFHASPCCSCNLLLRGAVLPLDRRYKHQPGSDGAALLPPNMASAGATTPRPSLPRMMELSSPAPPLGLRLTSDVSKAATVFLSHVRRSFARDPTDYTGELVRLLDDISIVTRSVASYVAESSAAVSYGSVGDAAKLSSDFPTAKMYKSLSHDGYACIMLSRDREMPLTFPEDAPQGMYVVCFSPLDFDTLAVGQQPVCGTSWSIYKRRSPTSLPGRYIDLQQQARDQVAAGYSIYSSATTLHYTMGHGVYSFVMHPVALQYFQQPAARLRLPEGGTAVYTPRSTVGGGGGGPVGASVAAALTASRGSVFHTGTLLGNVHLMLQTGGAVVATGVHFLCEAAPLALLIEQAGGMATDGEGTRILDMEADAEFGMTVTLVAGSRRAVMAIDIKLSGQC